MGGFWIMLIVSVAVVGLFALGMSLTLIFKGHNIKSEIGDNERLRREGIGCVVGEARAEVPGARRGRGAGCASGCASCASSCGDECADGGCGAGESTHAPKGASPPPPHAAG